MVLHLQLFFCRERGTPCNFSFTFEFLFTFIIYGYKKQCDVKKVGGGDPLPPPPTPMIRVCAKFNTPKYNDLQSED